MKIAYVNHPVSDETIKKIINEGYDKIIDSKFAPNGAEIYGVKIKQVSQKKPKV